MSPDEKVAIAKMALSEAGYPDARVIWDPDYVAPSGRVGSIRIGKSIPPRLRYQVRTVLRIAPRACYACWLAHDGEPGPSAAEAVRRCCHGDCSSVTST